MLEESFFLFFLLGKNPNMFFLISFLSFEFEQQKILKNFLSFIDKIFPSLTFVSVDLKTSII